MVSPGLLVVLVTNLGVTTRAQEGSGEDNLEANDDFSDYSNQNNDYYAASYAYDLLRLEDPDRGDMKADVDEPISAGEGWIDIHNDFADPVFCRENCQGAWDPDNIPCVRSCPHTPWVSQEDVTLELSCTTEAAVLNYDVSKLLGRKFKDLKIELSQEDEESLEAGEDSYMSYEDNTEYPIINIDQDDGVNEVSA